MQSIEDDARQSTKATDTDTFVAAAGHALTRSHLQAPWFETSGFQLIMLHVWIVVLLSIRTPP